MALEPGQRIGDYEVVAKLGAGGLGVVYEVRHLISQRREALKILHPEQSGTPEMVERFHREVQTLAALNHVNIAALHNAFYHENQLAMVMEFVQGETLRDLRLKEALTLPQALDYVAQILRALVYAHGRGVVHRDIKPTNVMIADGGVVKLLDFGIAITNLSAELTQPGYLLGSLNYMSPEQLNGSKATSRSDLYSVGVTLYELLTGRLPITGNSAYEIMAGHVHEIPSAPHQVAPQIPLPLSEAVMVALAKDPAQRFASAEDFLRALNAAPAVVPAHHDPLATTPLPNPSGATPRPGAGPLQPRVSSSGFQNLALEEISRKLAVYIGPVAKIVVKKLAAQSDDPDLFFVKRRNRSVLTPTVRRFSAPETSNSDPNELPPVSR